MSHPVIAGFIASTFLLGTALLARQDTPQLREVVVVGGVKVSAPTKDGWWIRVNTARTKATRVHWQLGTPANTLAASDWWYHSGHPTDVAVAAPLRYEQAIHIEATTTPADAPASLCVFWQQQVVALVEFTGTTDRQLNANMKESRCIPAN